MNFEIFKRHPYWTAGGGVVIFVLFYLWFKSKSSGAAASGVSSAQLSAVDQQTAQINAAESAAQMQMQGQLAAAQINASTQQTAITAAQTVQTQQSSDALSAIKDTNATKLQETQAIIDAFTHQTDASATIEESMIAAHTADVNAGLEYATQTHVHGSQNNTSIAESAMGNVQGSVAAEQGATISNASDNGVITSIAGSASKALSALFA